MADNVGTADAFAALTARAEMEAASERRATIAAASAADRLSDNEIMRIFAAMLRKAALLVDVPYQDYGWDFQRLAEDIVTASQRGAKLSPGDYRVVYEIWSLFRRAAALGDEAAAS